MCSNPLVYLQKLQYPSSRKLMKHEPKAITENKEIMLMYNLMIPLSVIMENKALQPDIVLRYKNENKALLIEVSVPSYIGLNNAEIKKMTKYQDLKNEVKRSWKMKGAKIFQ